MRRPGAFLTARLHELTQALMLLTRLPVPRGFGGGEVLAQGRLVWAYPLAGVLVGLVSGGSFYLARLAGFPDAMAAVAALAASALVTGALHEDGLSDFWDGLGGGKTRADKLRIMRDSAQGAYGSLAMLLGLAARGTALAALAAEAVPALIAVHAVARGVLALVMRLFPAARADGLTATAGRPRRRAVMASLLLAGGVSLAVLPLMAAILVLASAIPAALATAWLARRQLGGLTGDVLGAAEQLAEIAALWAGVIMLKSF